MNTEIVIYNLVNTRELLSGCRCFVKHAWFKKYIKETLVNPGGVN